MKFSCALPPPRKGQPRSCGTLNFWPSAPWHGRATVCLSAGCSRVRVGAAPADRGGFAGAGAGGRGRADCSEAIVRVGSIKNVGPFEPFETAI